LDIFGLPKIDAAEINSFINYANALFIIAGIFIFFYIIFHAVFVIRYWALSKKVENILNKVGSQKELDKQAIIIFCIVLVILVTGVISMTYEMCIINKQHGDDNIITLTQCITISSTAIVCYVLFDALRRFNKMKGTLIISTKNLFI